MTSPNEQRCPRCKEDLSSYLAEKADLGFCLFCRFPLTPIAGKYQLLGILGEGGFGTVYRAKHLTMHRDAERVVKVMKSEIMGKPGMTERFLREVQMTSALSQRNPHIVRVFDDFGEITSLGFFYVMEFLDGKPLTDHLSDRVHLPSISWCLDVFAQLCDAMQAAHEENIVHRDLKPDNIFLIHHRRRENFVKVLDFGIAKPIGAEGDPSVGRLTQGIVGTPFYVAPEQINNTEIDARTDIFTMGVILHEMLTGEIPLIPSSRMDSTSLVEILTMRLMAKELPSLRSIRPDREIPEGLDQAVRKALSREPADRFPSAEAFWEALQPYARESTGYGLAYGSDPSLHLSLSGASLALGSAPASPLPSGVSIKPFSSPSQPNEADVDVSLDVTDEMKPLSLSQDETPAPLKKGGADQTQEEPWVPEVPASSARSITRAWIFGVLGVAVLVLGVVLGGGVFSSERKKHGNAQHSSLGKMDENRTFTVPARRLFPTGLGVGGGDASELSPPEAEMVPEKAESPEVQRALAPPSRRSSSRRRRRRRVTRREKVAPVRARRTVPPKRSAGPCRGGEIFLVVSPRHPRLSLTLGRKKSCDPKGQICRPVSGGFCIRKKISRVGIELYGYVECIFSFPKGKRKVHVSLREDDGKVSDLDYCLRK